MVAIPWTLFLDLRLSGCSQKDLPKLFFITMHSKPNSQSQVSKKLLKIHLFSLKESAAKSSHVMQYINFPFVFHPTYNVSCAYVHQLKLLFLPQRKNFQ